MNYKPLLILLVILFIFISVCALFSSMKEGYTTNTNTGNYGGSTTYTGNNGGTATTYTGNNGRSATTYSGSNGGTGARYTGNNGRSASTYTGSNGGSGATYTGSYGNRAANFQGPQGNNVNTSLSNNYDNYSHYSGTNYPTIYYGPDGGTARVIKTDSQDTIVVTSKNGTTDIYYIENENNTDASVNKYYGPNGGSADMITTSDGKYALQVTGPNGSTILYTEDNTYVNPSNEYDNTEVNQYTGPAGGQATTITGPNNNTAAVVQPPSSSITGNTYDSSAYYNSLPPGIPRNQIPDGDEDLYILKSEVVPPVCPVCPSPILKCPGGKDLNDVPPCPPCARCPEPAFDCKKVPNYNSGNQSFLPMPVLNDFSTFGM